jgi:cysteine desulfurase/selenocysteine lyase
MFRSDFPIFTTHPNLVFLDSASSAQKPKMVIDSISRFFASDYANIHRWAYDLSMESSRLYELAKTKLAHLLGLHSYHEIVFTYNATYAFNILSRTLIKSGKLNQWDHILLSKADHHANIVPWQILATEYGIIIDWIDLHDDGTIDYTSIEKQISGVKLISITGASNVTGEILDLERVKNILDSMESRPIWVLDGSQRFPHMETHMSEFWIDFFVGTGHKVMSDTGIWFLAGRKDLLQSLDPAICWGGAINSVTTLGYDPAGLPFRHEPGTPHIAWAVSLLASLEYIESIGGFSKIESYEKSLVEYTLAKIKNLPSEIQLIGSFDTKNRLWVFSFSFKNHHPNDIAEILADQWICVRSGHHCTDPLHASLGLRGSLRMSLYIYNTTTDIDIFFSALVQATVI